MQYVYYEVNMSLTYILMLFFQSLLLNIRVQVYYNKREGKDIEFKGRSV